MEYINGTMGWAPGAAAGAGAAAGGAAAVSDRHHAGAPLPDWWPASSGQQPARGILDCLACRQEAEVCCCICFCCCPLPPTLQARQLQLNPVHSLPDGHNEMIFALAVDPAHHQFVTGGCSGGSGGGGGGGGVRGVAGAGSAAGLDKPPPMPRAKNCGSGRCGRRRYCYCSETKNVACHSYTLLKAMGGCLPLLHPAGGKDTYLRVWTQDGQQLQKLELGEQ